MSNTQAAIVCPACLTVIGVGNHPSAKDYAAKHAPHCAATEAQHAAAVERMRQGTSSVAADAIKRTFDEIVRDLRL